MDVPLPIPDKNQIDELSNEFLNADRLLPTDIEDILSQYPELEETLECIGSESTRTVFRYEHEGEGLVIKFAHDFGLTDGRDVNKAEVYIWDHLTETYDQPSNYGDLSTNIRGRFNPTLYGHDDGHWLIQPLLTKTGNDDDPDSKQAAIKGTLPYLEYGSEYTLPDNIGYNVEDDWYRIFDYGGYIPHTFIEQELPDEAHQILSSVKA